MLSRLVITIGIHISPPFWSSLPSPSPSHPSRLHTESLFEFPEPYSKFPLAIYLTHGNVSFHVTLSIHLTLSSPLPTSISLSLCLFLHCCPVNKFFSTIFLDSVYMCSLQFSSVTQLCLTLCDPRDCSPPGSPVSGILQARTLEWVAISFSNAWTWKWVPYRLSGGLPLGAGGVDLS